MIEYGELEKEMNAERTKRETKDRIRNELLGMRIVARLEQEKYKAALKRIYLCKKAGAPDETDILEKLMAKNGRVVNVVSRDKNGRKQDYSLVLKVDENGLMMIAEDLMGNLADDVYEIRDAKTEEVLFKNKHVGKKSARAWVLGTKKALELLVDGSKYYEEREKILERELAELAEKTEEKGGK